ncbi:MAG: 30S ribosomal protein THX [Flavobacteriales bacterium]|nr:30S ribosomal protein THX [Flavobacteriales bacterium]
MGKGDKKTRRGKVVSGTYGVTRKRKKKSSYPATPKKKAAPAKASEAKESAEKPATKKSATKKPAAKKAATKKATEKK